MPTPIRRKNRNRSASVYDARDADSHADNLFLRQRSLCHQTLHALYRVFQDFFRSVLTGCQHVFNAVDLLESEVKQIDVNDRLAQFNAQKIAASGINRQVDTRTTPKRLFKASFGNNLLLKEFAHQGCYGSRTQPGKSAQAEPIYGS